MHPTAVVPERTLATQPAQDAMQSTANQIKSASLNGSSLLRQLAMERRGVACAGILVGRDARQAWKAAGGLHHDGPDASKRVQQNLPCT